MTDVVFEKFPTLPFDQALVIVDTEHNGSHYSLETRQKMAEDVQWNHWANLGCAVVKEAIEQGRVPEGTGHSIMTTELLPKMQNPARHEPFWQD